MAPVEPGPRATESTDIPAGTVATVLALCALALAPTLAYRIGTDQGVFAYMGAALVDGRWPYLRTWESDFPGLMFLQAFEIVLLGKSVVMFRLFDLAWQLGNAYLILRIAARVSGRTAAYVAPVVFCLIYQGYGPWNTAQREGFGLVFVLYGFWLYFTANRRQPMLTALGIGLGLGVAVTIKPTLLALAAFYVPLAPALVRRRGWMLGLAATAGLLAPAAVIVGWYGAHGGLVQIYEACVAYQAIYTARLRGDEPVLIYWMGKIAQLGRNSVILPAVSLPFLFVGAARRERVMLWLGYLGSIYAVFVQGTFAGYHYLAGLGIGAVFIGSLYSDVSEWVFGGAEVAIGGRRIRAPLLVAHLVLAAAAVFYLRRAPIHRLVTLGFLDRPAPGEFRNERVFDFTEDFDVAAYLRAHTQPEESIQVWGYESLVYYMADRYASSRFQMTHPLVMRPPGGRLAPMQLRWREEFLRDVGQRPPAYVAVVRQDNWWWAPEQRTSEELLEDFPEWKRIIERQYGLEETIGRFLVYKRLDTSANPPQTELDGRRQ